VQFRDLGRTGLKVSAIGVGCMMFGWRADEAAAERIVATAAVAALNIFDTSVSYGRGTSETILGSVLKRLKLRDKVLVATKVGLASEPEPGPNQVGYSRHNVVRQCELSLRRLQADYIDILQIHYPSRDVPIEETMRALDQLVRDGKVRHIGTSNFAAWQIVESLWRCDRHHLLPVSCHQSRYNILDRRAECEIFDVVDQYGLGLFIYSPLAEGILSGKYRTNAPFPADSRFAMATRNNDYAGRLTPEVMLAVDGLMSAARKRDVPAATLAAAWILRNKTVSSILAGLSRQEQLQVFVDAPSLPLDGEFLAMIDTLNGRGKSLIPPP
jgi:aryl-alcohol dehydrogenase-like predicted oxidoreductase